MMVSDVNKNKVIITGTGYRSIVDSVDGDNIFVSKEFKINIGTAIAKYLCEKGFDIIMLSKTEDKLKKIKDDIVELIPAANILYYPIDVLDEREVRVFFDNLSKDYTYHYVHSAGLSTATYSLKNDNPYLPVEDLPAELPGLEFTTVVKSLLLMVKGLLPYFNEQKLSRVIVINSMSGIRSYPFGYSHTSAKGGLHNAVRALSLELSKRNIFFSEIMPGIVDTGLYDTKAVIDSVMHIAKEFGYEYSIQGIPKMNPLCVAEVVYTCLMSSANILSVNMVAQGQWPHQGA
jgi:NADP-dependent 3-hydroxy acid dehydrogenase YdfG